MLVVLFILIFTSIACSVLGVFLILRNLSMLTDAISHTVLLGIVISYFFVQDLSSPILILGAALMGIATVFLIEILGSTQKVKYHESIGVVFTVLFSIAVIIISKYFRNVHLDTDVVLIGEVLFSTLNTMTILGLKISEPFFQSLVTMSVVLAFIVFNFKKLKVSTFNSEYAKLIGINTTLLFYSLMSLSSLTAVISFNSVGAILVISFFIAPSATAILISKSLKETLILTIIFSVINCLISYFISFKLNVSISGTAAFINGLVFTIVLVSRNIRKKYINE